MSTSSVLFKVSLIVILAMLSGCAPAGADAISTATPEATRTFPTPDAQSTDVPSSDTPFIVYHRSGGFDGGDDTWVIALDGQVTYTGRGTKESRQLSSAQTDSLLAAVRAADFMSLDESYVPDNTCCDRFLYEITITLDGQTKTVSTLDAAPDQPERLTQLIDALNAALQ